MTNSKDMMMRLECLRAVAGHGSKQLEAAKKAYEFITNAKK